MTRQSSIVASSREQWFDLQCLHNTHKVHTYQQHTIFIMQHNTNIAIVQYCVFAKARIGLITELAAKPNTPQPFAGLHRALL